MYQKWMESFKKIELFKGIEDGELNSVLMCFRPQISSFQRKESIVAEGDRFAGIGIILEGEVTIAKDNAAGDRVIMAKLKENSIFGEVFAFSSSDKWGVSVIATTGCKVMFITPERIIGNCRNMCIGHRQLIQNMLRIVSQKALGLEKKIKYLSMKSIRAKACAYLLEQRSIAGGDRFMIPMKRNELAEFLYVSRPSLSREIIKMKDEGIIDFYRSSFHIMDIEALKSYI